MLYCEDHTFLIFRRHTCMPDLVINGEAVGVSTRMHTDRYSMYFFDERSSDYFRPEIVVYLWGMGEELSIRTSRDYTTQIPYASLEIHDPVYRESEILLEEQRQKEIARLEQERRHDRARLAEERRQERELRHQREQERIREEKIRQAAEELRIEQGHARIRDEEAEAQHRRYMQMVRAIFWLALIVVVALVVAVLGMYFRRVPVHPSRRLSATRPAMLTAASESKSEQMRG
jgi:hypothetical protein